ncbi:unnamed protein product [Xylocopa violacea]|uniref:C2 domain-containing protein n=1 Tax=Xylocopa violacea TaxID=135666 RepID=A0ABP1PGR8_XYLVO
MVHDDFFGPWGRIIIIAVTGVLVFVVLLLIACFFTPGCPGHECIRRRKREAKNKAVHVKNKHNDGVKLNDVSYRSWRLGSLYEDGSNGTINENPTPTERNSWNSASTAEFGCVDASSTLNLVQKDKQKADKKHLEFPTELTISLQYLPPCDEIISGKFVIGIEALSGLPPKQYNCTLEPYVTLNIVKQSWNHRNRQKLHCFRTRSVRHTASPIFKETFVVANVKPQEVKEYGNILLGVSYLPTAQRLTINVMKVRDVKFTQVVPSSSDLNPYVRVLMLNGRTGQRIKKKKTKFTIANAQPEFHETLTFDVTYNQLDMVQFLVVLCNKSAPIEMIANSGDAPSDSEDSVSSIRRTKDVSIGKVALGKGVRGSTERLHWFSVLQNPRKLVTVWHVLK